MFVLPRLRRRARARRTSRTPRRKLRPKPLPRPSKPLKHNWFQNFRQCNQYMIHVSSTWVLKRPPSLVLWSHLAISRGDLEQWGPSGERREWGGWSGRGGRWGQGPSRRCAPFLVGYLQQLFFHEHHPFFPQCWHFIGFCLAGIHSAEEGYFGGSKLDVAEPALWGLLLLNLRKCILLLVSV